MGVREWVRGWRTAEQAKAMTFSVFGGDGLLTVAQRQDARGQASLHGTHPTVHACVGAIARAAMSVPWLLYEQRGTRRVEAADHAVLRLLRRPNPRCGGASLVEAFFGHWLLTGNGYLCAMGADSETRPPRQLWNLPAQGVRVTLGEHREVRGYVLDPGTPEQLTFAPADVLHLKLFHPTDEVYGLSPLAAAAVAVEASDAASRWNLSLMRQSGRPSGAFAVSGVLTPNQREELRRFMRERFRPEHAGAPLLLEGGLSWQSFGLAPMESDWLRGLQHAERMICRVYGVPPEIVGDSEHKTFASYSEARSAFYLDTVLPLLDRFVDALNAWLVPRFGDRLTLAYDRDALDALGPQRAELWKRISDADFLTVNEKRRAVGYDDLPGGDVVLVSAAVMPLTEMGEVDPTPADLPPMPPRLALPEAETRRAMEALERAKHALKDAPTTLETLQSLAAAIPAHRFMK